MPKAKRSAHSCYFCEIDFVSKGSLTSHLVEKHYRCTKCDFWLNQELDVYDHTCVPVSNNQSRQIVYEMKQDTEREENDDENLDFRWGKCAAHKPFVCKLEELKNCANCRLTRFASYKVRNAGYKK